MFASLGLDGFNASRVVIILFILCSHCRPQYRLSAYSAQSHFQTPQYSIHRHISIIRQNRINVRSERAGSVHKNKRIIYMYITTIIHRQTRNVFPRLDVLKLIQRRADAEKRVSINMSEIFITNHIECRAQISNIRTNRHNIKTNKSIWLFISKSISLLFYM